jgi:hypothetical protein
MADEIVFIGFYDVFNVLHGVVRFLGYFLIRCALAEPQAQQIPILRISDVFLYGVAHIAVFVVWHNTPPKKKNAATVCRVSYPADEWRLILAALFSFLMLQAGLWQCLSG